MLKRFRFEYVTGQERLIIASSLKQALDYALRYDVAGTNQYGDTLAWGEIDSIQVWDSDAKATEHDEVANA